MLKSNHCTLYTGDIVRASTPLAISFSNAKKSRFYACGFVSRITQYDVLRHASVSQKTFIIPFSREIRSQLHEWRIQSIKRAHPIRQHRIEHIIVKWLLGLSALLSTMRGLLI